MDAIFKTQEYEKAANRLGEAQRSLHLLASSPDYLERKNLLLKLLNRLESLLSPLLVSALNENDGDEVRKIYSCFDTVGKRNDFYSFYYRSRKTQMAKGWEEIDTAEVNNFLNRYYRPTGSGHSSPP